MYKQNAKQKPTLKGRPQYKGETIEQKVNRITNNKEPIKDGAAMIYTARKDGVMPAYNIRTDRFEIAVDAMDKVNQSKVAQREAKIVPLEQNKDGKTESTGGTETN